MKHIIAAGLAALTMAAAIAPAAGALAQDNRQYDRSHDGDRRDGDRRDHDRRDNNGAAVAAGIAGLAVGAALANRGEYRDGYYYGQPQYAYDYYYGQNYSGRRHCHTYRYWDHDSRGYGQRTRCQR